MLHLGMGAQGRAFSINVAHKYHTQEKMVTWHQRKLIILVGTVFCSSLTLPHSLILSGTSKEMGERQEWVTLLLNYAHSKDKSLERNWVFLHHHLHKVVSIF